LPSAKPIYKKEMEAIDITISEGQWIRLMDELAIKDYVIADHFINDQMFRLIMDFFQQKEQNEQLRKAGIRTSGEFHLNASIRGDYIHWLDR